ncbi:uncharacterized protein LOC116567344 [Mustela erminea]|uniref:uncharacterized protein LOC116567344 n=1 Tax=Mustela erminea TaxID=36723 RepID=UPI0013873F77|nr:uncharacterized protein LOC116567344 [Mustela erminea]
MRLVQEKCLRNLEKQYQIQLRVKQRKELKGDREKLKDSQETGVHKDTPVMDKPPGQNPVRLKEVILVSVRPVTLKGTQESHRHTQVPPIATLDLNMESQDPQLEEDRASQETPEDIVGLGMAKPPGKNPLRLQEGDLVSVSPVTLKGTLEPHRHTQDPLIATLDLNMESQDPQREGDRELVMASQAILGDIVGLGMVKPPGEKPVGLQEVDLVSVSPVTLKGTQEPHRHTQDPLIATLDLNMESQDPQLEGDRVLVMASQEISGDIVGLGMVKPPGQNPVRLQEGDLVSVSPVTLKGTLEPHRHMQDPLIATLDLNMESQDPQLEGDRELAMASQEIPGDIVGLGMVKPPGQNPVRLQEGDLVSVSPVTLKGTLEPHRHMQDPLIATLDLSMESQDPQLEGDRELVMASQEIPGDIVGLGMVKPPGQNPVGLQEGDLVSVSPVTLKGTLEPHRHMQDPLIATLDLSMESQDPQLEGDRELAMASQEIPGDIVGLGMVKPPGQNPVGLQEGDLVSVSPVTLKGTPEPHRHMQDPLIATLDLSMESQDPQLEGDRELAMASQEIPGDIVGLGMVKPPGQNPVGLQEGDLVSVSPVTLKGTQEPHRHTQDPLIATLDLNMQSQDPQLEGDRALLMASQEIPGDIVALGMVKPPGQNPVGLQEGDLVSVSPVTLKGTLEPHRHMQDPLIATLDLNMESQDPQLEGDRELVMASQEIPGDIVGLGMVKPPGQNPVGLQEGDLVSVSPVTLKGTQEPHRHTQDPLIATLDLNMQSQDPQLEGDRELVMASQEISGDIVGLGMVKPPGQNPVRLQEGDLVSVSPVTLKGTLEPHRHMQDPLIATLDLNMESQDPQLEGDWGLVMASQEIPRDILGLNVVKPSGQNPIGLQEVDPMSVNLVIMKGTQEGHQGTPYLARYIPGLSLNTQFLIQLEGMNQALSRQEIVLNNQS